MGTSVDAGNSISTATRLTPPISGTGYLDSSDANDYYKVTLSMQAIISASLSPPSGSDFDIYLYDSSGTEVSSSTSSTASDSFTYTVESAGDHYLRVYRYSGSGNYSLGVTESTPAVQAESAHPYTNDFDQTWSLSQTSAGRVRVHFSQLDLESGRDYVYLYDENNNLVTSYTGNYRDLWSDWVSGSEVNVRLKTDGSMTFYGFTVDNVEGGAAATSTASATNVAVIVGINNYQLINGLRYAVPDAQDWKNYLSGEGYTIGSFLTDSQAESNIRTAITNAAAQAGTNGTLVLVFSGHGTATSPGDAHALCCSDAGSSSNTGYLTGSELQTLLSGYSGRLFVFFDSCHSGGMSQSVTSTKRYMTTICGGPGYGYDMSSYGNGA